MMSRRSMILLFIFSSLYCVGQNDNSWKHTIAVTASPVPIFNIFHPYGNLSVNYGISDRWAIEAGVGLLLPIDSWSGTKEHPVGKINGEGYRFHLEPKFKINPDLYISTEFYHLTYDYISRRYKEDNSDDIISYDVSSKVTGGNLLCGVWFKEKNFLFEMSGGIGVKFFTVKNHAPVPIKELSSLHRLSDLFEPEENGNHVRFTIPINLKLGVVF